MPQPLSTRHPWPARLLLAFLALGLVVLASGAAPPFGLITKVEDTETNLFRWEAPFSLWRWVIFAVMVVIAWFISFNVLMISWLSLDNPKPPRPKEAFATAMGWFILSIAISFVVTFAVLSNELYRKAWVNWFPVAWLNFHFLWITILAIGLALMFVARSLLRR